MDKDKKIKEEEKKRRYLQNTLKEGKTDKEIQKETELTLEEIQKIRDEI